MSAGQVVRGDLKQLWDLDLQGAPLAMTPMCDDRKEVEGFRFWKQGFWKNHLNGRPYHISALYVVSPKRPARKKEPSVRSTPLSNSIAGECVRLGAVLCVPMLDVG